MYELTIDWMGRPHTSNDERRLHYRQLSRIHRSWREAGAQAAMLAKLPKGLGPSIVTFQAMYGNRVMTDAGAIAPTGKCVIDGLVDWGCWPDDNSTWVTEERYKAPVLGHVNALLVTITPAEA